MKIAVISCVWPPYGGVVYRFIASQRVGSLRSSSNSFHTSYHGEKVGTRLVAGVTIKFLRPYVFWQCGDFTAVVVAKKF